MSQSLSLWNFKAVCVLAWVPKFRELILAEHHPPFWENLINLWTDNFHGSIFHEQNLPQGPCLFVSKHQKLVVKPCITKISLLTLNILQSIY